MTWRTLLFLCLLGGAFGCGADPQPGSETTSSDPSTIEFKRTTDEAVVAMGTEPNGLNPLLSTQAYARYVNELIFQTLNEKDPETFEQIPALASLPEVRTEAGGKTSYAYEINPKATWPNGLPVTAQDVVFSLKAMLNPLVEAGPYRAYYSMIENVVTNPGNERRFRIVTDEPYLITEEVLGSIWVYPEYAYDPDLLLRGVKFSDLANEATANRLAERNEALGTFAETFSRPERGRDADKVVGSGPYALENWEAGQRIVLRKRDNYWAGGSDNVKLTDGPETILFEFISDANTVGNALRDEMVDVVLSPTLDQFQELREDAYLKDRYTFGTTPSFKYFGILLNERDPLLADKRTRRALAHVVDIDRIIAQLFPGLAERVTGPILPAKSYYDSNQEPLAYDLDKARELLAAAGWEDTNGDGTVDKEIEGERRELSFQLFSFDSPLSEAVTLITAEGGRQVGMDIEVIKLEGRALYGRLNAGDFVASIYGLAFQPGPEDLTQNWASSAVPPNGTNRGGFSNPEADRLIAQIRSTTDAEARRPLYQRFQEIVYDDQPMVFLFSPLDRIIVSKRFAFEQSSITPNVLLNTLEQQDWNQQSTK